MDFRKVLIYLNLITLLIFICLALYKINISVKTFVDQPLLPNIRSAQPQSRPALNTGAKTNIGLANPASKNCIEKGGNLIIEKNHQGGEFGVCIFEDNRQCEEWALLRGNCPVGGIKITGYITPAARYCAISGGKYQTNGQVKDGQEQGNCVLPDAIVCDVWQYFNGLCPTF